MSSAGADHGGQHQGPSPEGASGSDFAHDLVQRFTTLAEAIPQLVWSTDRHGRCDYVNGVWCSYTGGGLELAGGNGWLGLVHAEDVERTRQCWQDAVAGKASYDLEYRLRGGDGHYRWMLVRGRAIHDRDGEATRWIGTCTDIHQTRQAADHNAMLSRELGHRIKNIFAVIGGLIGLTSRNRPEFADIAQDLQKRVLALGRAHDFVRPHSEESQRPFPPGSLTGMLGELLSPYRAADDEMRVIIHGDDVAIDDRSATPLALAFHELATNAAKYGALSVSEGTVRIGITASDGAVELAWSEHGGPPPRPPVQPGFGANLIDLSIRHQLDGAFAYDWTEQGLRFGATIPRRTIARG
jgi:PAS domain S-box-containing protein